MDSLKKILNRRGISKSEIMELARQLDGELFAELVRFIVTEKPPINQKAAWVFNHSAKLYPVFFEKNYSYIVENLSNLSPDGVKRDVLRGMLGLPVREEKLGLLTDVAMQWLGSFNVDVAVKYNSMRTLERIVKIYPELKQEFYAVLAQQVDSNTETFRRQASKILKQV